MQRVKLWIPRRCGFVIMHSNRNLRRFCTYKTIGAYKTLGYQIQVRLVEKTNVIEDRI